MSRENLAPGAWEHRGWRINCDFPPIPTRKFDWSATHPDYEGEGDRIVHAETYADLLAEIDQRIEELAE